jgi:hypothetical protein
MKTLHNPDDLTAFGVHPLTGEADAYGRRVLCDLSQEGVILLTAYFGLSHTIEAGRAFPANWNSWVGEQPAVACVMLARGVMQDLMVFALLHVGRFDYVYEEVGLVVGFNEADEPALAYYRERETGGHLHQNAAKRCRNVQIDGRNVHAMSGRVL